MKILLTTLLFSLSAMAAETAPSKTEATAPTTPKQVCEALAKAAADNNYKAFTELSVTPPCMRDGATCTEKNCTMHSDKECTEKNCSMHAKKECTDKNCPMHKKGKKMAKGEKGHHHHHHHHMMGMGSEEDFKKMHEQELARLKDLTCKDEKIAGNHAWVEAASQKETRLVPFKLQDGQWKFDMHTYHAFYHETEMKK